MNGQVEKPDRGWEAGVGSALLAHAVRSPLSAVRLCLQDLAVHVRNVNARRRIDIALQALDGVFDTIHRSLTWSQPLLRFECVDLREVVSERIADFSETVGARDVKFVSKLGQRRCPVFATRVLLDALVTSLLTDAIEHATGNVRVSLRRAWPFVGDRCRHRLLVRNGRPRKKLLESKGRSMRLGHGTPMVMAICEAIGARFRRVQSPLRGDYSCVCFGPRQETSVLPRSGRTPVVTSAPPIPTGRNPLPNAAADGGVRLEGEPAGATDADPKKTNKNLIVQ